MKAFKFNPITGQRGEFITNLPRLDYTDESIRYAVEQGHIEPLACKVPAGNSTHEWCAHIDAGNVYGDSFRRDEWICFCHGQWNVGQGRGIWQWAILPPTSAVKPITK